MRSRALAAVLAFAIPVAASAAGREGGSRPAGPVARPAPQRAAPPPRTAPAARTAGPAVRPAVQPPPPRPATGGGFNLNRDVQPSQHPVVRGPQRPTTAPRPITAQRTAPAIRYHGPAVPNPHHWSGSWGWNRGVAWSPAPAYWGGGFWGPWALGALTGAVLFGAIVDTASQTRYPSYQVEPESPGAELLQNYGLQQTPCGPPDLVVIWGPDNSVICAFPNANVGPGEYELDPETLSLTSASP